MSAFEVSLTPTRAKNTVRKNEAREPVAVILAPFSGKSTVVFEDIPVTKIARRFLNICNPSEDELKITLTRGFKPELNVSVEWTVNTIPARRDVQLEIVWNPLVALTCNESIQFTDNRNFRKDVVVIFKSVNKGGTKNAVRYPNISCGPSKQLSIIKPTTSSNVCKVQPLSRVSKSEMNVKRKASKSPTFELREPRQTLSSPVMLASSNGKENVSPVTPTNASDLFDMFNFTPSTDTRTKQSTLEALSSLPTPISRKQTENMNVDDENIGSSINPRRLDANFESSESMGRRGTPRKKQKWSPRIVVHSCTPPSGEKSNRHTVTNLFDPQIYSTTSKRNSFENIQPDAMFDANSSDQRRKLFESKAEINKTFELSKGWNESIESSSDSLENIVCEPVMNKTTTICTPKSRTLSVIHEEDKQETTNGVPLSLQETFEVPDENLLRDIHLVGTPLRKSAESMRDLSSRNRTIPTQGSMPNLNEMGTIQSIEQNRYYRKPQAELYDLNMSDELINAADTSAVSVTSTHDVFFDQHEILAQSSRFNVHEIGQKINLQHLSKTPSKQNPGFAQIQKRSREHAMDPQPTNIFLSADCQGPYNMAVSPPKRTKVDANMSTRPGTNFRVTKWSTTQSKKLTLQKPFAVVKKPITPRKIKTEPRIMLYDSELYLQPYINPDPFAATTTFDPFLASTMFLDERSVSKHEEQFKKWLNALVTLPADLDPDCSQKIDVGRLFNEVRNKDLILAPTKEDQSVNYLTKSRMDALRSAAVKLFMSPEMIKPCTKVAVYINKHSIEMRKDRHLHLDVVMQRYILELLLSFNPLWLRIGLEVVFGEIIYLQSNSDVVGLSSFILNRLFRDRLLEQKYSRAYSLSEQYATHIKKFTLQKFLFLMLFLDTAKNKRIIKHNPCLFVKNSKYKETKEILLKFSSELLANVGDITRNLKRHGYVLTHKQCFLDEFTYAFNNLAVDLRDGIRLTRVMEIILLREDLTRQLRAPAISRLQRIFNVNLALKSLAEADFVLTGDIYAADIVDGHREKTLSLLWQIIYKFRSPKFHAAATVIQKWWRSSWLKVVVQRRIKMKIEIKRNKAATRIQSAYRGYITRKYTKIFKWERTSATICFQKYIRRYLAQKYLRLAFSSVLLLQRWYRATVLARQKRTEFMRLRSSTIRIQQWYRRIILARRLEKAAPVIQMLKARAKVEYQKAIVIQRVMKSYTIRKKLQSLVHGVVRFNRTKQLKYVSAARIQSFVRMIRIRREFIVKRTATVKLQRAWRSYKIAKSIRTEYLLKKKSVITIQVYFRSYLAMKVEQFKYNSMRSSAITIQRKFRTTKLAKFKRQQYLELKSSTITIQRHFRATMLMQKCRAEYRQLQTTTTSLQRKFRATRLMRIQRAAYVTLKSSAITIQQRFRAQILMKRQQFAFRLLRSSTIKIQQKLRATLLARKVRLEFLAVQFHCMLVQQRFRANRIMQQQRSSYLQLKNATLTIQRQYRANKLMQSTRKEYLRRKNAAINIQRRFRAYRAKKLVRARYVGKLRAVLCIQKCFRRYLHRKEQSAVVIQRRFRAMLVMREVRSQYLCLRSSVLTIQRHFRAHRLMLMRRAEFVQQRNAALVIQRRLRAQLSRNAEYVKYNSVRTAVLTIQHRFKAQRAMKITRHQYQIQRNSAIVLQRQFRAIQSMRPVRFEYLNLRSAVLSIQRRFRANLKRNGLRKEYLLIKMSTVNIQRRFRAIREMKKSREEFTQLRNATVVIQRRFRATKLMQMERTRYLQIRRAAIVLQSKWVATLLRNKQQAEYRQFRNAVLTIQSNFRAKLAMQNDLANYQQLKKSVIYIQRRFRALKEMRIQSAKYKLKKNATIVIQRWYRSKVLLRTDRTNYSNLRHSAIVLQTRLRAQLQMQRTRREYVTKRNSAIKIQEWLRLTKLQKLQRVVYIRTIKSVQTVQTVWRATIQMRITRCEYLALRTKTIVLQRHIRSYLCMKSQRQEYQLLKRSAVVIQQRYRAHKLMLENRACYQTLQAVTLKIQRWFRAIMLMRIHRKHYLELRWATVFVQQTYRGRIAMQAEREAFLKVKSTALGLQTHVRGVLARRRFNELLTPERREEIRRKRAAKIIQRFWRGYAIRKRWQSLKIRVIRKRIMELKATATADNTVKSKVTASIKMLKQRFLVTELLSILIRLENISRTIPYILKEHAVFIASFCYGVMAQSIRSEPDKQIIELCSRIILNLARCKETKEDVFQEYGLVTIAQMLLRWCDKDCGIFNTLCTLVWVFSQCVEKKEVIRNFMTTHEAMYMGRETKKLVLRKEKMRLRSRKPVQQQSQLHSSNMPRRTLPHVEPDYGVAKHKPYTFICPVFAFDTILLNLDIRITT